MNERIRQLAEQATNDVKDEFGHWINSEFNKEKFAELLAQEAADVAYNTYWNNPDKVRGAHLKQAIQQHFGVRS